MGLGRNGQGITLARDLAVRGVTDAAGLARWLRAEPRAAVFGHTFPTGDHALLLYYWLAAAGIDPLRDVQAVTVPPPQMAASLAAGHMAGYCAGEPWNARAVAGDTGFTVATSQQIWSGHPGKVLATAGAFADLYPNTCRALVAAVLDAARWLDAADANRAAAAEVLSAPAYIGAAREDIAPRLLGQYHDGRGGRWSDPDRLTFHADGQANYPWLSDALWFLTQQRRWGLLRAHPDYEAVGRGLIRERLYREAAELARVPVPAAAMRGSRLQDGVAWDGSDPARYADGFAIGR
jgi:nitrate/nitrite transport system substrate-binding protein